MKRVVGIDLGTTNSVVSIVEGGEPVVIVNAQGSRTTPSVVAVKENGERLVGIQARNQAVMNPDNTVYSVKHLMGQRYDDPEIVKLRERLPYTVIPADNGAAWVEIGGQECSPPEIAAMILAQLKASAEAYLNEDVGAAVITVPAYFDDSQRSATKTAGELAGFEVERIINEPTAAALAYGSQLQKSGASEEEQVIAVYDLGGGTFDISIVEVSDDLIEVRSTNGDTFLGGDDFDDLIISMVVDEFHAEHSIDLRENASSLQRLKEAATNAKHELSTLNSTQINLPFISANASGPLNLTSTVTQSDFEARAADLIQRTLDATERALDDAGMAAADIDRVLLVGGQTRMPAVRKAVEDLFGQAPEQSLNPDEAVAMGAAVQGNSLGGGATGVLLLDVTPLTLSVRNQDGRSVAFIPRNTAIPTSAMQDNWSTVVDYQTAVRINVLQGEEEMAADNKLLGEFVLNDIRRAPAGEPRIAITFEIDADGILHASAEDLQTGAENRITVNTGTELDDVSLQESRARVEEFERREREQYSA